MMKSFDVAKLRKEQNKIKGISAGFNDPTTFISTGCYALDYRCCNRFGPNAGIALEGQFVLFAGDSGSGKSFLVSGNMIADAQKKGIFVVLMDTENACTEKWLTALGVDTSPDKLERINVAKVDDVALILNLWIERYKESMVGVPRDEKPRLMFVIDSLGMLITDTQEKQFEEGDQKGDLGIKAKQLTATLRVFLAKCASEPIGLFATNHVYMTGKYESDQISGGWGLIFTASTIVQLNKYLLKEDEDGATLANGEVAGIRSTAVIRKSRFAKPFTRLKIDIDYEKSMDRYSGLFDLFLDKNIIKKTGNRYEYVDPNGEVFTEYRKNYKKTGLLDRIMNDWDHWEKLDRTPIGIDDFEGLEEDA